ncbi:MAG TPA: YfiR family protein [Verrucomicrobiae bacterium]|nr:YfiR family protein [Verrucomicrobiae bacterium]
MISNVTEYGYDGKPTTSGGRVRFRRATRGIMVFATAILGVLLLAGPVHAAQTPALTERQVKALFLFNFAKYVDWPASAFSNNNAAIVIDVVGEEGLSDEFKQVTGDKTVNGRKVVVKQVEGTTDIKDCQILFICASEKGHLQEILEAVKNSAVLTVGETDQFLAMEGMINFTKKENKIHLEINLTPAQRANLKLSSKLLTVADVVLGKPEGKKD